MTPKHCNRTSVDENERSIRKYKGIENKSMFSTSDDNKLEKIEEMPSGKNSIGNDFGILRHVTEAKDCNGEAHRGTVEQKQSQIPFDSNSLSSKSKQLEGRYYKGLNSSVATIDHTKENITEVEIFNLHTRNVDSSDIAGYPGGGYYPSGSQSSSRQPRHPNYTIGPNHYRHSNSGHAKHYVDKGQQFVPQGRHESYSSAYSYEKNARGNFSHNKFNAPYPSSSRYYGYNGRSHSGNFTENGRGPNFSAFSAHGHTPQVQHHGQQTNSFRQSNGNYRNTGGNSYPPQFQNSFDENSSFVSRVCPQPSSIPVGDTQRMYSSHSTNSNAHSTHQSVYCEPLLNQTDVERKGENDYHSHTHQIQNEEHFSHHTKYQENARSNGTSPSYHHNSHDIFSFEQKPTTAVTASRISLIHNTPKTSHHHRIHPKTSNNLARTVSSSFEGITGSGNGPNTHSNPLVLTNKKNHEKGVGLAATKLKIPSTLNPAFAQDVATHHGEYGDEYRHTNDCQQHQFKDPLRKDGDTSSQNPASDSSWLQLNKVASVDHNEYEKRKEQNLKGNSAEEIELPLNLQANPSNLDSLASLSSVASIQEQLPLESAESKDESDKGLHQERGRQKSKLSYESDTSNVFNARKDDIRKCKASNTSEKQSTKKQTSSGSKRNRESREECRNPRDCENSGIELERSSSDMLFDDDCSPTNKKQAVSKSNEKRQKEEETPNNDQYQSPMNLPSFDSSSLMQMPLDSKLDVPKFTDKKEAEEKSGSNEEDIADCTKVKQPKPKYPSSYDKIAEMNMSQNIRQAPKSKNGLLPKMQSSNSSFTSTSGPYDNVNRKCNDPGASYKHIQDSRDKGMHKGFVPLSNRPGSSSSGSITVGGQLDHERNPSSGGGIGLGSIMLMPSMPSWDIQNQDSFTSAVNTEGSGCSVERISNDNSHAAASVSNKSTGSVSGIQTLASFSFSKDCKMLGGSSAYGPPPALSTSSSNVGENTIYEQDAQSRLQSAKRPTSYSHEPSRMPGVGPRESRNQSFDSYSHGHVRNQQTPQYPNGELYHHNFDPNGRNHQMTESDRVSNGHTRGRHPLPYAGPTTREHDHYSHHRQYRGESHEERTSVGGSFGAPPPPHQSNHRVSRHGPPPRHYPPTHPPTHPPRITNASSSWGGPPPAHHYPSRHSHISHGPVPSQSFGSSASSQQRYTQHSYPHRPNSPPRYQQHRLHPVADDFQPPPREFMHNNKPPPTVFIVSNPNENHHHDRTMGAGRSMKGVYNWSKDDDAKLSDVMKKHRNPKEWEPIAKEHGRGKSAKECHERWIRYLKPGVRKGQWQDHEDAIVVEAVTTSTEQPFTRWSDLAQRLPGRVGKQIRDRWVNHLNPAINHMPFTREDDLLLFKGHDDLGKRWVEISTKYFNSTRSENHIKNRWYSASFKKFIANEFGPDAYAGGSSSSNKNKEKRDEATIHKRESKADQLTKSKKAEVEPTTVKKVQVEVKKE